ncbi:hypothetical protein MROS_1290 [Melioribacter roseus P3M-2]|uniref:Uncharacterized protein n=1 Tax=Melioribacter roseus (strain DSM 23840 / JCM 17771 / VKM B-2668 / P3M-2) TaxID=1191523 RepID=I6YVF1_MELRP|nr:hypothetical protein MROS_1290 [Melioribacter roseus P3M-2]
MENGSSGIRNLDYKAFLYELDYELHEHSDISEFSKKIKPYMDRMSKNKLQIRTLEKLRDTLLPMLMSGEVRVKY